MLLFIQVLSVDDLQTLALFTQRADIHHGLLHIAPPKRRRKEKSRVLDCSDDQQVREMCSSLMWEDDGSMHERSDGNDSEGPSGQGTRSKHLFLRMLRLRIHDIRSKEFNKEASVLFLACTISRK